MAVLDLVSRVHLACNVLLPYYPNSWYIPHSPDVFDLSYSVLWVVALRFHLPYFFHVPLHSKASSSFNQSINHALQYRFPLSQQHKIICIFHRANCLSLYADVLKPFKSFIGKVFIRRTIWIESVTNSILFYLRFQSSYSSSPLGLSLQSMYNLLINILSPVVKISPELVTDQEQGKISGRIATFSLWTGKFRV